MARSATEADSARAAADREARSAAFYKGMMLISLVACIVLGVGMILVVLQGSVKQPHFQSFQGSFKQFQLYWQPLHKTYQARELQLLGERDALASKYERMASEHKTYQARELQLLGERDDLASKSERMASELERSRMEQLKIGRLLRERKLYAEAEMKRLTVGLKQAREDNIQLQDTIPKVDAEAENRCARREAQMEASRKEDIAGMEAKLEATEQTVASLKKRISRLQSLQSWVGKIDLHAIVESAARVAVVAAVEWLLVLGFLVFVILHQRAAPGDDDDDADSWDW